MSDLKLNVNLFDMSDKEIETSEMMYEGKIIKCLVAPYHTFAAIEKALPYSPTTFVYPEREMNINQIKSLISILVSNPAITDEVRIVTANQNIIMDMVDTNVRVLTEGGDILPSPCKTMMANIHTIRYELLENEAHQLSNEDRNSASKSINDLITTVNDHTDNNKIMSRYDYDTLVAKIDMIGEDLIRVKLREMAHGIQISKTQKSKSTLTELKKELETLAANMPNMDSDKFETEFERIENEMKEHSK